MAWDPAKHPRDPVTGRFVKVGAALAGIKSGGGKRRTPPSPLANVAAKLGGKTAKPGTVPTWDELGRPQGPSPVGVKIGHLGGTYERLPGEQRQYRVITADGRDISKSVVRTGTGNSTADDARTALRMDAFEREDIARKHASGQVAAWDAIPGSWSYDGSVAGFDAASPAERERIRAALSRWATHGGNSAVDPSRMAEPPVNRVLRGARAHDAETRADLTALDQALAMSRTTKAITVYRGVSNGTHILPADWQNRDLTGVEWSSAGFTPVTGAADAASAYVGAEEDRGFGVRIRLPKGSPAVAIRDELTGLDDEGEILLPRDLKLRVTKDRGVTDGVRWLDVEIVRPRKASARRARPLEKVAGKLAAGKR